MVNVKLLKNLHEILSDGFHSSETIAFLTGYTKAYIWHELKMLSLMGFIKKKDSEKRKNRFEYSFSKKFRDFDDFLNQYLGKLGD